MSDAESSSGDDFRAYAGLHATAFAALFCVGVYASSFGPALPFIADDLGVSLDTAGLVLSAFFLGSIAASALVAVALHGEDTRKLGIAGLITAAAGAVLLAFAPTWLLGLAGGVVLGVGDGLMIAALHMLMSTTSRNVPGAINRLNIWFAVGAVAGPLWAGGMLALTGDLWLVFGGVAALLAATAAAMAIAPAPSHERLIAPETDGSGFRLPGHPTAWIMGIILFLYVGAEFGLGSWVSTYARESADAGVFGAAVLTSGYWAALMVGRLISGWYYGGHRDPGLMLLLSIGGAGIASIALALSTGNLVLSGAAAFGAGLCMGPIWPTTVSIGAEGGHATAAAATVTIGNSGGVVIPWLQGRILVSAGPAEGVVVTGVLCAVMLAVALLFQYERRRERRSTVITPVD